MRDCRFHTQTTCIPPGKCSKVTFLVVTINYILSKIVALWKFDVLKGNIVCH